MRPPFVHLFVDQWPAREQRLQPSGFQRQADESRLEQLLQQLGVEFEAQRPPDPGLDRRPAQITLHAMQAPQLDAARGVAGPCIWMTAFSARASRVEHPGLLACRALHSKNRDILPDAQTPTPYATSSIARHARSRTRLNREIYKEISTRARCADRMRRARSERRAVEGVPRNHLRGGVSFDPARVRFEPHLGQI
jgi:hypothetical protein